MSNKSRDISTPFTHIYDAGGWSNLGSGPGSSPSYNRKLLKVLAKFIKNHNVKSVVDYGCGDWQMFRRFNFGDADYLGIDVVQSVITKNMEAYARPNVRFQLAKPMNEGKFSGDLLFVKDVFLHLPNESCQDIINYAKTNFKHSIFVNDLRSEEASVNIDIEVGGYRPVDISKPPFVMPSSTLLIYGSDTRRARNLQSLGGFMFGEKLQSGLKHVQLLS